MASNRIEDRFRGAAETQTGALIPYLTSGFPDLTATEELIRRADGLGVCTVELGIPFSDSIADGPVIQDSFNFVLQRGQTVEDTFRLVSRVRASVRCGLVAMVSYSLVHRKGIGVFMERAAAVGFDGVILPDVPVEESLVTAEAAKHAGLCHIGLVAPTTSVERREAIARASSGFVYQIAVRGTTGERSRLPDGLADQVARLREIARLPVCVGFGISTAEQVRAICGFADGAIVGSAIVRRLAEGVRDGQTSASLIESVCGFLSELMAGITP